MNYSTRHTLLQKALYLSDDEAWSRLMTTYKPPDVHLLHQYNLQHHDIEDVSQRIFIKLTQKLQEYDPNKGKFRHWLGRIIKNEALDHLRARSGVKGGINTPNSDMSQVLELMSTPSEQEKFIDQEWKRFIYKKAWENVKGDFSANAQRVFELNVQGKKIREVMDLLQLEYNTVRNFKSRVKRAMRKEVERLTTELDEGNTLGDAPA